MIEAIDLSLKLGGRLLFERLNLRLNPGEVLALIGSNGAGKSSLLRCLAGTLPVPQGRILLAGKALGDYDMRSLAQRRAVFSQSQHLSFPLRVLELVMMGRYPYLREESAHQSRQYAEWALAQTQMLPFMHRELGSLSGGEQQQVHLARALAQVAGRGRSTEARYLLLDEPAANLDLSRQQQMLAFLRQLAASENMGILIILHDMNLAARYADRVVLLHQGRILCAGTPEQVFQAQYIQQAFNLQAIISPHPLWKCPQVTVC